MPALAFHRDDSLPFLEAKRCMASDLAYQKHFHEEYSIGLIDQGETNAWCDGTQLLVEAGRMISFPPLMMHACQPLAGMEWQYKMLYIKPEWFQGLKQRELDQLYIPYLLEDGKNKACRLQINRTMEALTGKGTPLAIESALIELVQALVSQNDSDLEHEPQGKHDQKYANLIKEYLHAHFAEKVTLENLEAEAGISRFHLVRLFKKWSHLPPHAYQILLRINHAKTELAKQRPIADVAAEAGFYDQSHFARAFVKIVGATPQKYALSI
ncbi:AraC family transcriptional regulator [Bacillus sp. FJAT-26390]|uniref:helix-turn-helix transcriptional regulator n=1 Tax=Bacillus sp. FJAT-26390 TaxID=1743142 RepID=UPI000807D85A|nr:AraC family transcriptional regulator [Bacillus sp. FJAT-26390]OBZ12666.1 AraC family transcriptional regulator [Bacillus sp. FJAT-26390]